MKITRFEDIDGWKISRQIARAVFNLTRSRSSFPDLFLMQQLRKCPCSMMANIAEGFDSGTDREFIRFLRIAYRSGSELQSHLYLTLDEGYITTKLFNSIYSQTKEAKSAIAGFIRYLKKPRAIPQEASPTRR